MKIYKTQSEVEKDIKNDVLAIEGDVCFECSISISASIVVTGNINARDINARDINAGNINAGNITARNINAGDILYYAFCCVYQSIKCLSIKAKREIHQEPICLEGEVKIKKTELDDKTKEAIELLKKSGYKIVKN